MESAHRDHLGPRKGDPIPFWGPGRRAAVVQKSLGRRGSNGSFIPFETRFLYSTVLLHFGRRAPRSPLTPCALSPLLSSPPLFSEAHVLLLCPPSSFQKSPVGGRYEKVLTRGGGGGGAAAVRVRFFCLNKQAAA